MENTPREQGILDVIATLAAERASGRLQINTGMTEGALFFDSGQLVDARLGKLSGFQAINALATLRDASYNFDPGIAPPAQSSITANQRLLLKDFFGIETAAREPSHDLDMIWQEDDSPPAKVVPLTDVKDDDESTLVKRKPVVTEPAAPLLHERPARSSFRPALLLIILAALIAAVAVAFALRSRQSDSTASVAPPVIETPSPVADVPEEAKPEATSTAANLSGDWKVVNTVEQSSYAAYKNMEIGFNVSIDQAGNDFTGKGEKISENGRSLPAAGRTPITVKGTIDGDKVEATFWEKGAVRKTNGRFVWRIDKGSGGLKGTFVSTAARTSGKSAATKKL
ncbi:MAG TPA: DUF4388 domain-containing protein [Pyrinomonadaceae bacterium]|jgi:Domain of unknown function (DUF4388)|nr:DUF4388 domain-containing protein [Pyrinomonadaceae bacterium]